MPQAPNPDLFTRLVKFAFDLEVPGATAHDRLAYLQALLKKHNLELREKDHEA